MISAASKDAKHQGIFIHLTVLDGAESAQDIHFEESKC
jgi:hypothetical protein